MIGDTPESGGAKPAPVESSADEKDSEATQKPAEPDSQKDNAGGNVLPDDGLDWSPLVPVN